MGHRPVDLALPSRTSPVHRRHHHVLLAIGLSAGLFTGHAWGTLPPAVPPQHLPLEAQWCVQPGTCIALEVADEPREQSMGMQLREPLAPLHGMWFRFDRAAIQRFWMHRTLAPLDMVFIQNERVIAIEANASPCPRLPCRTYGPNQPADSVVELAAGEASRLGIGIGDAAVITPLQTSPTAADHAEPAPD